MVKYNPLLAVVFALGLSTCGPTTETPGPVSSEDPPAWSETEFLTTPEFASLGYPFSEAVRVGSMLFLSGQLGNVPGTTELVPGGIEAETRQTMENISAILERYGSSMDRVVKCTIMIDDMDEWPAMNQVYAEFFPGPKPVRSAFGADGLALGARVEIECWATVGQG